MDTRLKPRLLDVVALRDELAPSLPGRAGTVVDALENSLYLVEIADAHGAARDFVTVPAEDAEVIWSVAPAQGQGVRPARSRQLFEEGLLLLQNRMVDQAKKRFAECFLLEPELAGTLMNLGIPLAEKNAFESAMFLYQLIIDLQPNYLLARENLAITYLNRGTHYARLGALDKAMEDYNACLWLRPSERVVQLSQRNLVAAFTRLGITHVEIKRYEEALTYFIAACQLWPFEDTRRNLALALVSLFAAKREGRSIPGRESFRQPLQMGLTFSECLNAFGATLASLGHIGEGMNVLRAALEADPDNALARRNIDILASREGPFELSPAMWGLEAVEPEPTHIATH